MTRCLDGSPISGENLSNYLATAGRSVGKTPAGTGAASSAQPAVVVVTLPLLGIVILPLAVVLSGVSHFRVVPRVLRELASVLVRGVVLGLILNRHGDRADGA